MDEGFFIVGFLVASIIFISNDPNVTAKEIEAAQKVCEERSGVKYIVTSVTPNWIEGKCEDGLRFSKGITEKDV